MSTTQQRVPTPSPDPQSDDPTTTTAPSWWRQIAISIGKPIGYALATIGLVATATGVTLSDAYPWVLSVFQDDANIAFVGPKPVNNGPAVVKRCTTVRIAVTGDLSAEHELWLGTNRNGRKVVVEPLDPAGDGTYSGQITIGQKGDFNQKRQLVALLVGPETSAWLRNIQDGLSRYDVPSLYWPPGTKVMKQIAVQRDAVSTRAC
ncbi:hypothetical protein [Streptomyces sp. SP18BB07]|uniref:hypothetical protein n=1 Tax=Streptomyces sp. SP18BB07 TaxID=3002522 RepID=UPI002E78633B|nr:hypothetical protein [Streptomyces sp. SP18BB07]MEE1764588.1 hypothetical protein [Streptomyces sp. SP18BB07]